jgi:hypothetical protein
VTPERSDVNDVVAVVSITPVTTATDADVVPDASVADVP